MPEQPRGKGHMNSSESARRPVDFELFEDETLPVIVLVPVDDEVEVW